MTGVHRGPATPLHGLVLGVQGWWVRRTIVLLPPAGGPTSGETGEGFTAPPMRIAVVGESTAAGCGVSTHDDGFAGALARGLAERTGGPVHWDVVGQHGATARRIRYRLLTRLEGRYELVVLLAGANDVLSRRSADAWRDDLVGILDGLDGRADRVVVVGTPPFGSFPSLPGALRRYLAGGGEALDAVTQQVCASRPSATWVGSADAGGVGPEFFAGDGFHPSVHGYRQWAETVLSDLSTVGRRPVADPS